MSFRRPQAGRRPPSGEIGGGKTGELALTAWKLDDFHGRMATSALDPLRAFDAPATPTHWTFLDLDVLNDIVTQSCADVASAPPAVERRIQEPPATPDEGPRPERLLRLPEVGARTGMGRCTIYNRVSDDAFPAPVKLGGDISAWRESEV